MPPKIKQALGIASKESNNWAGSGNGSSVKISNDGIDAALVKQGLTAKQVYHSEYDSSD